MRLLLLSLVAAKASPVPSRPNILLIVTDDLGVNDVSWNQPAAPTPNLAKLAATGVVLDNAYREAQK